MAVEPSNLFPAPADLTTAEVTVEILEQMETEGVTEFDALHGLQEYTPEQITRAMMLRTDLDRVKAELSARRVRANTEAAQAKLKAQRQMAELNAAIHGMPEGTPEAAVTTAQESARDEAIAAAAARGVTAAVVKLLGERRGATLGQANLATLGQTAQTAPKPKAPEQRLAITAAANGQDIPSLEALGQEFTRSAQSIPVTRLGREAPAHPVAKIRNDFTHTVDNRMSPGEIEEIWRNLVNRDTSQALVAGGGWCAPSEIMYGFFNIADSDGLIDLPTVGVSRGGIKFPVSPAIGDVFFQDVGSNPASGMGGFAFSFSNATDPWLWTESDDQATVTGSVNKPTLRVPCPSFSEVRLEAYGLTVTAGNLTDSAYPESTQNFIRLLRMAYAHAINGRLISLMDAASTSATAFTDTTSSAAPHIFNAVALAATDYRARYAMRTDAVLECVMPYWVKEVIRADLGWKPGIDSTELLSVMDSQIDGFFTARAVRVQWVNDYQVRGSGQFGNSSTMVAWPTTANFLLYAAGTFLHGTGLTLDLGVVRDSVLNAENDFTAAWAEEAHLVAMVGHASRKYAVGFTVTGNAGGAVTTTKL